MSAKDVGESRMNEACQSFEWEDFSQRSEEMHIAVDAIESEGPKLSSIFLPTTATITLGDFFDEKEMLDPILNMDGVFLHERGDHEVDSPFTSVLESIDDSSSLQHDSARIRKIYNRFVGAHLHLWI